MRVAQEMIPALRVIQVSAMKKKKKLCLMVDTKSSTSSVSSLESIDESYERKFHQQLDIYNELHEEARKL